MKKIFIIISLLVLTACQSKETPSIPKAEKIYKPTVSLISIEPGLEQSFTVTGDVLANQSTNITSELRGKVERIFIKEGDSVKKGQSLIQLSSADINTSLRNAQNSFQTARVQLETTKLSANESVRVAEASLETAKTNLQNTLTQNKAIRKQAEETLNAAEVKLELSIDSATTDLKNAINDALPAAQTAFNTVNKIIGATEAYRYLDTDFRKNLGVAKVNSKNEAEEAILDLETKLTQPIDDYSSASSLLEMTEKAVSKTLVVLNNSVTGADYSQSQLITDINAVTPQLASIRTKINTLNIKEAALRNVKQESEEGSQTLIQAEANYQQTLSQLEASERSAYQALESAQANVENAKKTAELNKVSAQSNLTNVSGQLNQAAVNQDKLNIIAPFSGKIRELNLKEGQEVNPNQLLVVVEDDSRLKIISYLSEKDARKIEIGDSVEIVDVSESARINSISSSADPITRKYKVELVHESQKISSGNTVNLQFSSNKSSSSSQIFVPLTSLHILPEEIFVWTLEDNKTVKKPVKVGEIIGNYAEIISGINIGEKIIGEEGRLIDEEGTEVEVK